jgi:hypothetical protein
MQHDASACYDEYCTTIYVAVWTRTQETTYISSSLSSAAFHYRDTMNDRMIMNL